MKAYEVALWAAAFFSLVMGSEALSQTAGAGANSNAEQNQAQTQGQTQATSSAVVASGNSAVSFNGSFNGAEQIRSLPIPSSVPVSSRGGPAFFGRPNYEDKGSDFISMRQIAGAMNLANINAPIAGEEDIKIVTQLLKKLPAGHPKGYKGKIAKKLGTQRVSFEINDGKSINQGFDPIAVISAKAQDAGDLNSASLALAIAKKASHMGADRVIFLTEGSSKELHSSGWGIGLSYNYASVGSSADDHGSVGAGGTGYSQGEASYSNLVYLTAIAGK